MAADDYEHHNKAIFNEHHGATWPQVEEFAATSFRSLVEQVERLSDTDMLNQQLLPWQGDRPLWRVAVGTGFDHPLIHISDHYKKSGEIERAADVVGTLATKDADLDDTPEWQGVIKYNLACRHSLLDEKALAIDRLREALTLNPGLLDWSKEDPDLEAIRGEPACQAIYEGHAHPDA